MPAVTTLHTILASPDAQQHHVMAELTRLSERIVVMSAQGAALLQDVHGVPAHKIDLIPHGIPSVPAASASKDRLGVEVLDLFDRTSGPQWPWFEDRVTYCNGRLPQALLASGARVDDPRMVAAGTRALNWLVSIQRSPDGYFAPVGSDGGRERGTSVAAFDHQPVEACVMVSACLVAHQVTGDACWIEHAQRAFNWFLGQNHLQRSLYDASTGGCRDGLHAERPNENRGAESTLSFLLALVDMRSADRGEASVPVPADSTACL